MIPAPRKSAQSAELADWLEISCFASPLGEVPIDDVNDNSDIEEDAESENFEASNIVRERKFEQAWNAIFERTKIVSGYPFQLLRGGNRLRLTTPVEEQGYAYLFCLLLSNRARGGVLEDFSDGPSVNAARDLFQVLATISAADLVHGPAYSFGFPRPDRSGFLAKLTAIWNHLNDGAPIRTIQPGLPPHVKDDGVDVIAWQHNADGLPGVLLLGQAGSGRDWEDKSIVDDAQRFIDSWFNQIDAQVPRSQRLTATFTPFLLDTDEGHGNDFVSQEAAAEQYVRRQNLYARQGQRAGQLIYRHRMPTRVAGGLQLARDGAMLIERHDEMQHVISWVDQHRKWLQAS